MKSRMNQVWLAVAIVLLGAGLAPRAEAGTIYVTPEGTGSGADWASATSLTNALLISRSNDVIWVAQGRYTNSATFTVVSNNITLYGGLTNGMATLGERNWTSYPTILDGQAANRRVAQVTGANVLLDGLMISNSAGSSAGGIIKNSAGLLTLANCRIVSNTNGPQNGVGAYFGSSAVVMMTNCTVAFNQTAASSASGHGIYASGVTLDMVDCLVNNQSPLDGWNSRDGNGGALYFNNGVLRVVRTDFINNRKGDQGGGGAAYIGNTATTTIFSNCVFRGNTVVGGYGGALYVGAGSSYTVDVINCTFTANSNTSVGAAVYLGTGTLNLKNCILWTNRLSSGNSGSDIYQSGGTLLARYCRVSGGQALPYVYLAGGSSSFLNCMTNDPLFASATDLHLQSPLGRWNGSTFVTTDTAYSPCIDAGDPADPVGAEITDNGNRRNLGAYGGTAQASKSPNAAPLVCSRSVLTNNYTQMILRGELTNDSAVIATVGICYGTNNIAADTTNGWQYVYQFYPPQQTGTVFTVTTPYLLTNTLYYCRTYATNGYGGSWAPVESFVTTNAYPPLWGVGGGANVIHVRAGAVGENNGSDWFSAYPTVAAGIAAVTGTRTNIWITGASYAEGAVFTLANACTMIGGFAGTESTVSERALTNALGVVTNYSVINGENGHRCLSVTASGTVLLDTVSCTNAPSSASGALGKSGSGLLVMNNCRLVQNAGGGSGGGGYFSAGSVLMTNCVVADNKAAGAGTNEKGFGLLVQNTTLDMVDCLVSNNVPLNTWNSRDRYGGGIAFESGTLSALRTEFIGNRCADQASGGAVYIARNATFSNCVFRGNQATTASSGAGLSIVAGAYTVSIVNCTFAHNTNSANGGAIYQSSGTVNLKNCILWTNRVNTGGNGSELYFGGGTMNVNYCDLTGSGSPYVFGSPTLANCMYSDPLFASATDLHEKSTTGRWDPATQAFVTSDTAYSPCIDAGDPTDPVGSEPTDNDNIRINMGAYGGLAQASKSPPSVPPELADRGYTVNYNRARISGELTNATYCSAGVYLCYGTNSVGGDTTNGWDGVLGLGDKQNGTVFPQWTGVLLPATTYYYRWFAVNNDGSNWTAAASFVSGAAAPGGAADVIHVNKDATGAGDGTSWPHAYTKIIDGLAAVNGARSNVWITAQVYSEGTRLDFGNSATIVGGFAGTESAVAQRAATNALGVVTNYTAINGANAHGCLNITAGNVWLDTLVFSNSPCQGNIYGGLTCSSTGSLVANNCRIVRNSANGSGAGGAGARLTGANGNVLLTNCVVAENALYSYSISGGGIYAVGPNLRMVDCVVSNNGGEGFTSRHSRGIGVYFDGGAFSALRSDFLSNTGGVEYSAAGVHVGNGANTTASFTNCVFRGQQDLYLNGYGAAICFNLSGASKTANVVNCTFAYNRNDLTAGALGGAIFVTNGTLLVKSSIFWTNAVQDGVSGSEIYVTGAGGKLVGSYSDFAGTNAPHVVAAGGAAVQWGSGIITNNPLYVSATDVHLKSQAGRWDAGTSSWVLDTEQSPCIDMGDPNDAVGSETQPNGRKINMGAYGGTVYASRTLIMGSIFRFR